MSQIASFPVLARTTEKWTETKEAKNGLFSFLGITLTAWQPKWFFGLQWTSSRQTVTSARLKLTLRSCEDSHSATAICLWLRHDWPVCPMSVNMCAPFHSLTPSEPWPDEMFSHKARLHRWMGLWPAEVSSVDLGVTWTQWWTELLKEEQKQRPPGSKPIVAGGAKTRQAIKKKKKKEVPHLSSNIMFMSSVDYFFFFFKDKQV